MYKRPWATAMLSQTGAASSLYSASFSPVEAETAQRTPPSRPSYPWAKSSSGNATGVPATNKTSPAKAAAAADTGDKADQRRKAAEAREAAAPLKKKAQEAEKTMERLTAKIASLDADLARPDIAPHETRQRLKDRARFVAEKETAEATWLEASEAYDAAVR